MLWWSDIIWTKEEGQIHGRGVTVCSVGWLVLFAFVKQALVKFFAKILQRRVGMGAEKGSEAWLRFDQAMNFVCVFRLNKFTYTPKGVSVA